MKISERRNVNRGYRQLVVWQDAITYYSLTCEIVRPFQFELKKIASQQMAAVDSIHHSFIIRESNAVYEVGKP